MNFRIFAFLTILMSLLLCLPAGAQDEAVYYSPITEVSLNIKELTMNVGDQVTLPVTYEPAETPNVFLQWYMDETTVRVDPGTYTVTALSAGTTRLLVESVPGLAWDHCDITVVGPEAKDTAGKKTGTELITLSDADRKKIEAESLLRYLDFIEHSDFVPEDFASLTERRFNVTAVVSPGTVNAQSGLAASLGMEKALELPDFSAVSLYGTLRQILEYTENNDDLVRLFEFEPMLPDDPVPEPDHPEAKDMNLQDNVEELTSVSKAHALGLKGDNTVIAIIDSGLNKEHEQFRGRVIAEYCAARPIDPMIPSCDEGSSEPVHVKNKAEYNHGSHVAGIAAGRDGIAPNAKIVSINNSSEFCVEEACSRYILIDIWEICQYLADLQKSYKAAGKPLISAVNISFGNSRKAYEDNCDERHSDYKEAFDLLLENGMIPVTAAGNSGFADAVQPFGCVSSSFAVGALANSPDPKIRSTSSHGPMIDILAPGTKIWSALLAEDGKEGTVCSGINCYGFKNGTSMAAPMVTGAFAILKQANPSLTPAELESVIINMSHKTANYRAGNDDHPAQTFPYDKPVLDFSDIEKYISPADHHGGFFRLDDMEVLPRTGFSAAGPREAGTLPKDLKYEPLEMTLEIPSLDVSSEIVEVPVIDNEYAVTWLGGSVGLLEGSALPGKGTAVLAAHNHLNDSESGPFALLASVEEGERIFIRDSSNELQSYTVYANEKVAESDFDAVDRIAGAFDDSLVLITCEDERISGGYASRRVVAAKRNGQ